MGRKSIQDTLTDAILAIIDLGDSKTARRTLPNGWRVSIGQTGGGSLYRVKLVAHNKNGEGFDFGVQYGDRKRALRVARKLAAELWSRAQTLAK